MEYLFIGVIVAAALACPVLMCGPMLLRRFGIIKGGTVDMSCMGMTPNVRTSPDQQVRDLKTRRAEIDAEIARAESAIRSGAAQVSPAPSPSAPHSTKPA